MIDAPNDAAPSLCHLKAFPIPVGAFFTAICALPVSILMAVYFSIRYPFLICAYMLKMSTRKYYEYTVEMSKKGAISKVFACCNWYVGWYLLSVVVILALFPILVVLLLVIVPLGTTFSVGTETFEESDCVELAGVDKGMVSGLLDRMGLDLESGGESTKENCSEKLAKDPCCGMTILAVGDILCLTGIPDGFDEIGDMYRLFNIILGGVVKLLRVAAWAEESSFLGIDVDVMPLELLFKKAGPTVVSKMKDEATENKKKAKPKKMAKKQIKKEKNTCKPNTMVGLLSLAVSVITWAMVIGMM
jgi:hypothetical protein